MRLFTLTTGLAITALLATGCSDDTPAPTADPTVTATAPSSDPFETLRPPVSPGVGSYDGALANRAYQTVHGYLALQLLEKPTLVGDNGPELVSQLTGARGDTTIARDVGGTPTRRGLDIRPLFPRGTTLTDPVASVIRSVYTADEVQGLGGEQGLRITWSGALSYPITFKGKAHTITYTVTTAYVFSPLPQEPNALALQQTVLGDSTAQGVLTACVAKGLLYPGPAGAPCPA